MRSTSKSFRAESSPVSERERNSRTSFAIPFQTLALSTDTPSPTDEGAFFNHQSGVLVIHNPGAADLGSAYAPTQGIAYFLFGIH